MPDEYTIKWRHTDGRMSFPVNPSPMSLIDAMEWAKYGKTPEWTGTPVSWEQYLKEKNDDSVKANPNP